MHLQYLCFFDCYVDVDACIYSTCGFFDCQVEVDVDNVQCRELVIFLRGTALYIQFPIIVIITFQMICITLVFHFISVVFKLKSCIT